MKIDLLNNEILVIVDANIYTEDVLYKCFYWYGANFNVEINKLTIDSFQIRLQLKVQQKINESLNYLSDKIKRDLIDFKLRDIITKETKNIRDLIVAKAFAYYGLEDNPLTETCNPSDTSHKILVK